MPHTRSAKKNVRKNEKRRLQNRATLRTLKTYLKRVQLASEEGTVESLREEVKQTIKKIDKAAARNVIHANKGSRLKSKVARLLYLKEKGPAPEQPKS